MDTSFIEAHVENESCYHVDYDRLDFSSGM